MSPTGWAKNFLVFFHLLTFSKVRCIMQGGGGGGAMPIEPWMLACGFRFLVGKLKKLDTNGKSTVQITKGIDIDFEVDEDTVLIGLEEQVIKQQGMVRVNLRDTGPRAVSIERYFTSMSTMAA